MSSPNLVRWYALAALLGGALSVAEGLLILANPGYWRFDSPLDYLVVAVEGATLLAILGGLVGLYARQAGSYGRLGAAGCLVAFIGTVLAGVGHIYGVPFFDFVSFGGMAYVLIGFWLGSFLIGGIAYVLGVVAMSVGLLLVGLATMKAGVLPVWGALAPLAGLAGLWAGNSGGWILFGLGWLAVAYALRSGSAVPAEQSPTGAA